MPLTAGSRLGPYDILSPLGAGGFGEVYKARDTRLDRTVAIKILPSADPELKARFEREAKAIAALTHSHICTLYDVGHQDGTDYLVMEYIEGETLDKKIARGPIPVNEALKIAIEIGEALDTAHRAGIVHRDLKPANVMLTKSSGVKLLDFGLAKLRQPAPAISRFSVAATITTPPITFQGSILGTLHYMSPEQLEGGEADARSDVFAFGVVLYEVLAGKKPFEGTSNASLIGAILHVEPPPLASSQPLTSRSLERIVKTCLAKDPDERWQNLHDITLQLQSASDETPAASTVLTAARRASERLWMVLSGGLALGCIGLAIFAVTRGRLADPESASISLTLNAPIDVSSDTSAVLSPDGRRVAFTGVSEGKRMVWVRSLDSLTAQPIVGTDGVTTGSIPFWSPDSQLIGFFALGKLKTVAPNGSPPQVICDAGTARGAAWGRRGSIVFAPNSDGALYRVSAAGGTPVPATTLDKSHNERSHRWPQFLPDGNHFLYLARGGTAEQTAIYVGALESTEVVRLMTSESDAQYAPPNLILFWRAGTLMAQHLDTNALRVSGSPVAIAPQVAFFEVSSRAYFSVSQTGLLAYRRVGNVLTQLTWIGRNGSVIGTFGRPGRYSSIALSPDKQKAALTLNDENGGSDIWIADLTRDVSSRLTIEPGRKLFPVWSPDGSKVAYALQRPDFTGQVYRKASSGAGPAEEISIGNDTAKFLTDWSRDGSAFVFHAFSPSTQSDIWRAPAAGGKPTLLVQTPFIEVSGRLSPDGRWLAYSSDESGELQVYVQSIPPRDGKWRISTNGGRLPEWRSDGQELYFVDGEGKLVAAALHGRDTLEPGVPTVLFDLKAPHDAYPDPMLYAATSGGQKFLVNRLIDPESLTSLVMVLNWTEALKK